MKHEASKTDKIRCEVEEELRQSLAPDDPSMLVVESNSQVRAEVIQTARAELGTPTILVARPGDVLSGRQALPRGLWAAWVESRPSIGESTKLVKRIRQASSKADIVVRLSEEIPSWFEMLQYAGANHLGMSNRGLESLLASLLRFIQAERAMRWRLEVRVEAAKRISRRLSAVDARRAGFAPPPVPFQTLAASTRRRLTEALAATGGCKAAAARILGISRSGFYRLIERYGVDVVE